MGLFQQLDLNINFNGDFHIYIYTLLYSDILLRYSRGDP